MQLAAAEQQMQMIDNNSRSESVIGGSNNANSVRNIKVKPRLRAEGLMAPPASDAATLRRQVAALQADVEAHIEAEQRLQSFNQQLGERLEMYMKQNHENLERAASEMNTLHQDMEQTLELQRRLSKRASVLEGEKKDLEQAMQNCVQMFETGRASLQKQVMALTVELKEHSDVVAEANTLQMELDKTKAMNARLKQLVQRNSDETVQLNKKIEECSNKIQSLLAEERRNEELEGRYQKALLKRFFEKFVSGVEIRNQRRASKEAADENHRLSCCRQGFAALKLATKRSKKLRISKTNQTEAFLRDFWNAWRLLALLQRKHDMLLHQHRQSELLKSFYGWKNVVHAFQNQCGQYADLAAKHWHGVLTRRAWEHWIQWIHVHSKPKKMKLQDAVSHLRDATLALVLSAWKSVTLFKSKRRAKMEESMNRRRLLCIRIIFEKWQEIVNAARKMRRLQEKATSYRRGRNRHLVMKCWKRYVATRRSADASRAIAQKHFAKSLKRKGLKLWKQNTEFLKAETKAMLGFNHSLVKTAMGFWVDFHVFHSIKKKRSKKASVHRHRADLKVLRKVLLTWWEEMVSTRHATEMQYSLASWWQRILLRTGFHSWLRATFSNALVTSSKCQSDLVDAMEKRELQKHRTTAVDVENLHLIDRLHMMSSEIAYLMTRINDKSKRQEDLQHALEDAAVIESSMRGDLEQNKLRIAELEKEALVLQRNLQKKNSEDVAGEIYHALHVQSVEQALRNVQAQLSQKTTEVESYEKALKDTADKLEGNSDESHQKLSSAFQIAASLRKLLEERESQCAALEGSCRRRDLELEEIQKKLATSKSTFIDTLEARDSRINELQKLLLQKQAQIEGVQQDTQDIQLAINVQDGCYKKLQYEMRLGFGLKEQQSCESWLA